jgi:NitT/TauT family transport system substrate-binding protein
VTAASVIVLTAGVAACSSGSSSGTSGGTSSGTADVSVMVGGLDKQIYLPFMLAEKLGYYKDAGLNVTLTDEPAGVNAETDMIAGQVNGVGGFYDHNIDLQAKGQSTESVVSMLQVPGEVELCRTDLKGTIKSPADWKGRTLGITDLGSSTDFLTQYLATKNGVAHSDIHEIGVQAGPTFVAAMDHKSIDCGMTTEPTVSELVDSGKAYIIDDTRTAAGARQAFGGLYPATSLYMTTDWINSHKDAVQKLVNAYVWTLKWIQTHTAAEITDEMPPDYYTGVGKAAYIKALANEKGMYNPTGLMPADGPKTDLAVLQANADVKGKTIDLSKTYTNQFAQAAQSTTP